MMMTMIDDDDDANFFPYTIESIPVYRKYPIFPRDPDFQLALAVSFFE